MSETRSVTDQTVEEEAVQQAIIAPSQPFSASFFDKDEATSRARSIYLKALSSGIVLVILAIWTVLPIYWGALWKTPSEIRNLKGWVVDFDGGKIGQTVTQALANITGPSDMITWQIFPSSGFPNGPSDLASAVLNEKAWMGISINPGATVNLLNAVSSANASYNGSLAVTAYTVESRNENGYGFFIQPIITQVLQQISQNFALQFARQISTQSNLSTLLSNAPGVVTAPMSFTIDNLRPFDVAVAAAIDFVGLIYLLILSFITAMINQTTRTLASGLERRLTLRSLIFVRLTIPLAIYFIVSLFYSLLSLAFQAPFTRMFGHSGFLIYWMLSFVGMASLGLAVEAMITILTTRFIPFFLILWIISNVAVSFYPIELLPGIFRYGYAAPFYNVSQAVRTILFRTKNDVGLNFGVLIAWVVVSLMTIPLFQWFVRRREVNDWRRQQQGEKVAHLS